MEFNEIGFLIETTKDGSPTLRLINEAPSNGESMHHTGGAFSETQYIYGQALQWGLSRYHSDSIRGSEPFRVLSVGLGLGYIETLTATLADAYEGLNWELDSFEMVPGLRENFTRFYQGEESHPVYEKILQDTAQAAKRDPLLVKQSVKRALQENRLRLKADIRAETISYDFYHVICYDAFSAKTNPELWSEEFLDRILCSARTKWAGLSTYACMGNLKRSLRRYAFTIEIREGFLGKRNSTWAWRDHQKS